AGLVLFRRDLRKNSAGFDLPGLFEACIYPRFEQHKQESTIHRLTRSRLTSNRRLPTTKPALLWISILRSARSTIFLKGFSHEDCCDTVANIKLVGWGHYLELGQAPTGLFRVVGQDAWMQTSSRPTIATW